MSWTVFFVKKWEKNTTVLLRIDLKSIYHYTSGKHPNAIAIRLPDLLQNSTDIKIYSISITVKLYAI